MPRQRRETREMRVANTHLLRTPTTLPVVLTWCGDTPELCGKGDRVTTDPDRVTCADCLRFMRRDLEMLRRWADA